METDEERRARLAKADKERRERNARCASLRTNADLPPGNHAIDKLTRQMETSDAARPIYRGSDQWRAARA